jgi:hypothetical protein
MNRAIGTLVVLMIGSGCARKVTLAPEHVYSRNDPDWVIRAQPAAPAPAPAVAPVPAPASSSQSAPQKEDGKER